jgi:hypothetical protein
VWRGRGILLTRTERILIFERERDKGGGVWLDEWKRGVPADVDVDEDGFSDRATQGTEFDEREVRSSPVQASSSEETVVENKGKTSVRRLAFGCADLAD